jgi:hypothetical protein
MNWEPVEEVKNRFIGGGIQTLVNKATFTKSISGASGVYTKLDGTEFHLTKGAWLLYFRIYSTTSAGSWYRSCKSVGGTITNVVLDRRVVAQYEDVQCCCLVNVTDDDFTSDLWAHTGSGSTENVTFYVTQLKAYKLSD